MTIYVFCALLWLLAGIVAGITSFGGNLVAVPFITMLVEPRIAILSGCISGTSVFLGLFYLYRKHILWRESIYLVLGSLAGIPLGLFFLASAGAKAILLAAGLALCIFLLWQFYSGKRQQHIKAISPYWAFLFGCLSGIMMAAVGMGGPPLVLFAYLRQWQKYTTLGSVNGVSAALMAFVLPGQYLAGLYTPEIVLLGLAGAAAAFLGIIISIPLVRCINILLFRRLLLLMLIISAAVLLIRAL